MDYIFIDISYVIFYKTYALLTWFKISKMEFSEDLLIEKFDKSIEKTFLQLQKNHKFKWDKCYVAKDVPKDKIWRKSILKDYKENRVIKEKDIVTNVFKHFWSSTVKTLQRKLPYNIISVDTAEADDIIAVCVKHIHGNINQHASILIITNDHDFVQLNNSYISIINLQNVALTSKYDKDILNNFVKYKAIKGDASDNIPSIAKGIGKKKLSDLMQPEALEKFFKTNKDAVVQYELNRKLIDFDEIPTNLVNEIKRIVMIKK